MANDFIDGEAVGKGRRFGEMHLLPAFGVAVAVDKWEEDINVAVAASAGGDYEKDDSRI